MLLNVNINIHSDSKGLKGILKGILKSRVYILWKYLLEYGHQVNQDLIALSKTLTNHDYFKAKSKSRRRDP